MAGRRRFLLALAGAALLPACGAKKFKGQAVPRGASVLALGDSLTSGVGATPEGSYPAVLAALTGWNIVNGGISGDTSAQALARLPDLLQEHKPQLVIVGIGGNDLLRRMPEPDTKANIRRIVQASAAAGAQVLLIAIPRPTMAGFATGSLSDHAMYADLAGELKVPLHEKGWSKVLGDDRLRSDQIHANMEGYRQFAQGLLESIKAFGFL